MDITPAIPENKNVIKGYGEKSFKINEDSHGGSVILLPDDVKPWNVTKADEISLDSLRHISENYNIEILLIGCGENHIPMPSEIQLHFSKKNIGVEIMTTGAACRTYNVLLAEGREVAAALLAV